MIVLRSVGGYSPSLIEYLLKHVLLIRKRRTKGGPFPFIYREVLEIVLRMISDHSLSLIDYP